MRAIVYKEPNKVVVEQVPDPRVESPTDAVVRVTSAGICGSDLHMYEGRSPASGQMRFGIPRAPPPATATPAWALTLAARPSTCACPWRTSTA